ncbi:ABC transporter substrate-binding protein [Clostridium sp.]|uniref:ABC transporter substrate-binding protein n=1 Tax=Clostridium sp. TaxID=1506 RepID=UPI001A50437F|nr:ABC transporter substrate-binding protein [Clostridium sp.]MBK5234483.1 ABC transporter substrate-binding protein [Clostridium sp.]
MKRNFLIRNIIIINLVIIILALVGCSSKNDSKNNICIAEQFGLAYAPLQIMKENKILEKNYPDVKIEWKQLANAAAIREAMLSNHLDVGFMAIPPFLIGLDKGMEWKIASGLSESPVALVTNKENIKSIKDFSGKDRIALPQPGSIQHILLAMECEKEFGDAKKLDNLLVTLSHPDGMNAFLSSKDVTAHFTTPPYLFKELEQNNVHQILDGKEAIGTDFTFVVGVTTNEFHDIKPELYKALVSSIKESINFMKNNPDKSAEILANIYKLPKDEVLKYITHKDMVYTEDVRGVNEFAKFMKKNNYISNVYSDRNSTMWEDVKYEK